MGFFCGLIKFKICFGIPDIYLGKQYVLGSSLRIMKTCEYLQFGAQTTWTTDSLFNS